ncbi:MAG TPA: hypothetical protein VK790_13915 [Solirubrobacteraceae bacterium]|jgi:hypothetical protein|nr:hypothetical protein [Solirubrobacteraceae bacterium]
MSVDATGRLRQSEAWAKRGLLIAAPAPYPWACSHAALPAVERVDGDKVELLYSPRDARGRAHVARAHVQATRVGELVVTGHDPEPVLTPGRLGAFDESGVTMSCVVEGEHATFLYYTGWTLGVTVPFYFYAGLAIRPHGQREFERVSQAPILERNAVDPYLTASPWVLREGGLWRMWYVSCSGWEMVAGEARHYYHLRYAESADGIGWRREGRAAIDFADEHEYAISRPCVVRDGDRYRMWFAARGDRYRLGYAESHDGVSWDRDDARAGLEPSPQGWDAEMVAYPAILDLGGVRYMLYNGNGYGKSGIGYAVDEAAG